MAGYGRDNILYAKCRKFSTQIAQPIADLATRLQCSSKDYRWVWDYPPRAISKHVFRTLDLFDAKTHCRVMKDKFHGIDDGCVIGNHIFTMFPTLYRVRGEDQPDILVAKGSIVVSNNG